MRFKIYSIMLFCVVLLLGCSRSATSVLDKEPVFAKSLQYTQVGKIIKNKEVTAFVNVTYLNITDQTQWDNGYENFLIGFYDDNSEVPVGTIELKGADFIKKTKVDKEDKIYKNIALKSNWSEYFIYTFTDTKDNNLSLIYHHPSNAEVVLSFPKE